MARRGDNLPGFRARQLEFTAHVRDPQAQPRPAGVPEARMRVYRELVYNNIESFLAGAFPVAKQVLTGERWSVLVRDFIRRHPSRSPYFLDISQEFLSFLGSADISALPPFLLELCHYEWVELWLGMAEDAPAEDDVDPAGDLLTGIPVLSPLVWKLAYRYPVHRIGPRNQPTEPAPEPAQLLVYRDRGDAVRFMEVNSLTMALVGALDGLTIGRAVLDDLAARLPELEPGVVREKGLATMERLRKAGALLGTKPASGGPPR